MQIPDEEPHGNPQCACLCATGWWRAHLVGWRDKPALPRIPSPDTLASYLQVDRGGLLNLADLEGAITDETTMRR